MENGTKKNVWWLFLSGAALLMAGWFIKPFPVFMFVGLAPFFAIVDHTIESENFWEHSELILLGLALFFFSVFLFDVSSIVAVLVLAIIYTLPFLGFAYVHENLGPKTSKMVIIIFWLGLEYGLLKLHWPSYVVFLSDAFQSTDNWIRWNSETGYLGVSMWVLIANWMFYASFFRQGLNWFLLLLAIAIVAGPIIYSLSLPVDPITRKDMIELYGSNLVKNVGYSAHGELVARSCAWLSVLIVLFAVVKSRVTKK
jgi:apolipoprotein N-acyltransferase